MKRRSFIKKSSALGFSATLLPGTGLAGNLAQVSAVQRFRVGDFTVTALSDGFLELNSAVFPSTDDVAFQKALNDAFLDEGAYRAALNVYVVDDGTNIHLIDTGGGGMSPTVGQLSDSLKAAGYSPEQINTLLLTHLHPDHIGGAAAGGVPTFVNAELVVSGADHSFFTNADIKAQAPENVRPFFDMAGAAVDAYADKLRLIEGDAEIAPGITAMPLPGHTPGHTGYVLSSGDETLFIWGDIVHAPPLQFANPNAGIAFDVDSDAAAATRAKAFDMASADRLMVAGMHLTFPGVGHVVKSGTGYDFEPAGWQYLS